MGTYHYHTIRCPNCGEEDGQVGCSLDNCHFSQASIDTMQYPRTTVCQYCGEAYSFDDGCWTGDIPPWEREELISPEMATVIDAAVALAHKRIGFGEFKETVKRLEASRKLSNITK